jgi:hypothetical protein
MIRRHVLAAMPEPHRHILEGASLSEALTEYRVWRGRFVSPRARRVHWSPELLGDPKATVHQEALAAINARIDRGDDLSPHLSAGVTRVSKDRLLADWGLHHLHLSTELGAEGFVERTGDVLFAAFSEKDAYLLGIYEHPRHANWAAESIFAILVRNWPDSGLVHELRWLTGLSQKFSDGDRLALRNAGVASFMEVDGKVYAPGGLGITTAGTPTAATRAADAVMWELGRWRDDPHGLLRQVEGAPEDGYWVPRIYVVVPGFEEYAGFYAHPTFVPLGRIC